MTDPQKGVAAMALACVIWGLSPIYYRAIAHVGPLEVLSHRTLWSVVIFGIVLLAQRRLGAVPRLLGSARGFAVILFSSVMISVNWFLFIWSTQVDRVTESSLGYYIFPLVAVLFGFVFFGERLSRAKMLAVGLAVVAVSVLTVQLGTAPWLSLALAVTFAIYGAVKKVLDAGPVVSVTAEVVLLLPLAALWLFGAHRLGWQWLGQAEPGAFGADAGTTALLIGAGLLTAGPLILFSYAARRIALATAGVVQYLNPTLQFACALVVFGEALTPAHAIAFPLIWVALAIYSLESLRQERASRKRARASGTVSTKDT